MDKINKALKKFSAQEKKKVKDILKKLSSGDVDSLDIKKLKGRGDIFRVRKGDIRVLYRKDKDESVFILSVERRSEKTYKF